MADMGDERGMIFSMACDANVGVLGCPVALGSSPGRRERSSVVHVRAWRL